MSKMINIKKIFSYTLDTKKGFGNMVDVFQSLMVFQVLYCIMLTIDYNRYQNSEDNFQPLKYLSLIILMVLIIVFEKYLIEVWKLFIAEILTSIILISIVPIDGSKVYFAAGCLFLCLRSVIKHRYRCSSMATYGERFRSKNRTWLWVVLIIAAFLFHFLSSDNNDKLISPTVCTYYMLVSFAIFVISNVMIRYAFKFYEYYRQELKDDKSTEKQLKHSFMIIFIASLVIMGVIFILFGDLSVPVVEYIVNVILKIFGSILMSLFGIDISSKRKIKNIQPGGSPGGVFIKNKRPMNDSPLGLVIVVMLLMAAALYIIWKIYKSILANYKIGTDEAEFIPIREDNKNYEDINEKLYKSKYGKTNKEKVRKYYFQEMMKRSKKYNVDILPNQTPSEIKDSLSQSRNDNIKLKGMTEIYEKARYSDEDISENELNKMKDLYEKK